MSVTGATGQQGLQGYAGPRGPRGVTGTSGWVNTIYTNTTPFMNPTGPIGPIGQLTIAGSNLSGVGVSTGTAGMIYQVGSGDVPVYSTGTTVGMFWMFQGQATGRLMAYGATGTTLYKQYTSNQLVTLAITDTSGNLAFL